MRKFRPKLTPIYDWTAAQQLSQLASCLPNTSWQQKHLKEETWPTSQSWNIPSQPKGGVMTSSPPFMLLYLTLSLQDLLSQPVLGSLYLGGGPWRAHIQSQSQQNPNLMCSRLVASTCLHLSARRNIPVLFHPKEGCPAPERAGLPPRNSASPH